MKITSEWLKEKGACQDGCCWFKDNFKDEGDYQEVLDALAKINKADCGLAIQT